MGKWFIFLYYPILEFLILYGIEKDFNYFFNILLSVESGLKLSCNHVTLKVI